MTQLGGVANGNPTTTNNVIKYNLINNNSSPSVRTMLTLLKVRQKFPCEKFNKPLKISKGKLKLTYEL